MSDHRRIGEGAAAGSHEDGEGSRTSELVDDIALTRGEMGETIAAIEARLDPSELRAQAIEKIEAAQDHVREVVREQISDTRQAVKAELREAKAAVKQEVRMAIDGASQALHDATIGKVQTMARQANDTFLQTSDTMLDTVRRNPIPTALVGLGLAWLWMNRAGRDDRRSGGPRLEGRRGRLVTLGADGRRLYEHSDGPGSSREGSTSGGGGLIGRAQEGARHALHDARDAVGGGVHRVQDAARAAADAVSSTADAAYTQAKGAAVDVSSAAGNALSSVTGTANELAHRASVEATHLREMASARAHDVADMGRHGLAYAEDRFEESPLAFGAIALGLGAAVGLALPRTEGENRMLGAYREQVVDAARAVAHDAVGQLRALGEDAGEAAIAQLETAGMTRG